MVLAEIGSGAYNVMLLIHIVAVVVGFAPAFFTPVLMRLSANGQTAAADALEKTLLRYALPGIGIAGFIGFGLAGMSDKVYSVSQTWLSIAAILWVVALLDILFVARPALKKWIAGDTAARGQVMASTGVLHLILIVTIILMIWKPGL
ncbi:MAG: hypothetical protein RLZZ31_1026 [Actinomycetota bacterium]|jgi:uncharacterized membrane protein